MNKADVLLLKKLDEALAGPGLDPERFRKRHGVDSDRMDELLDLMPQLRLYVEVRQARASALMFYTRGVVPLFRTTPIPETRGRKPRIDRDRVYRLIDSGLSRAEVAKRVGCTTDAIRKIIVKD